MAMIVIVIMRMLLMDRIPPVFLIVLAVTLIGFTVALFEGQSFAAALYGWRRMFQYPLVGLYVYVMPHWPPKAATWILRISLIALVFNTAVQLLLFALGEKPSDSLAGMFGVTMGAGQLIMFVLIVVSFGLGKWLAQGDWHYLVSSLGLGAFASSLGSMKLFPAAVLSLAAIAIAVHLIRARYFGRLIKMIVVLVLGVISFVFFFNWVAGGVAEREIQEYLDPTLLNNYLGVYDSSVIGVYKTGRNSEAVYVWDKNLQDPLTFLFGKGIGARAESSTLGISGTYFESSFYPTGPGKSLPVLLQETGLIGMLTWAALCVALIMALFKKARSNSDTDMAAIQYGLITFTALWPLWLWYQPIWIQAIPMLLYWTSIGFALNPGNNHVVQEAYEVG
jgi:hypothetical protein